MSAPDRKLERQVREMQRRKSSPRPQIHEYITAPDIGSVIDPSGSANQVRISPFILPMPMRLFRAFASVKSDGVTPVSFAMALYKGAVRGSGIESVRTSLVDYSRGAIQFSLLGKFRPVVSVTVGVRQNFFAALSTEVDLDAGTPYAIGWMQNNTAGRWYGSSGFQLTTFVCGTSEGEGHFPEAPALRAEVFVQGAPSFTLRSALGCAVMDR